MARNIAYGHDHRYTDCGIQAGSVDVATSSGLTTVAVTFPEAFAEAPVFVAVSPRSAAPYTGVRYASASDYTANGFKLHIYRADDAANTTVTWMAVGKMK